MQSIRAPRITDVIALHGKFRKTAMAVKFPSDPSLDVTYAEFVASMNQVAYNIVENKLSHHRVATLLNNNSPKTLSTMFGIAHGGASLVPLNATLQPDQLGGMLLDSKSKMVVACEQYSHLVPATPECQRVGFDFSSNDFAPNPLEATDGMSSYITSCYLIFSSWFVLGVHSYSKYCNVKLYVPLKDRSKGVLLG
jgi:long-subunit acyl-CoA synthetase (AMP-forming)